MKFISSNKVRMHDTDMAGILYFARQFRFAHDALEDFLATEELTLHQLFESEDYVFVIVHAEADYLAPMQVGEELKVELSVSQIGNSSFTTTYEIYREKNHQLLGKAKLVHVTLTSKERTKIPIPDSLKKKLEKYYLPSLT